MLSEMPPAAGETEQGSPRNATGDVSYSRRGWGWQGSPGNVTGDVSCCRRGWGGQGCGGTWGLHSLVVVGVDTDFVLLHVEGELAHLHGAQLVVAVQVGPAPQAAVDDVGEPLPVGHLQPPIQGPAEEHREVLSPGLTAQGWF